MRPEIVEKLDAVLKEGVRTEERVVYLLVELRKLLERENDRYFPLVEKFCDWIVHPQLDRKSADAHQLLKDLERVMVMYREVRWREATSDGSAAGYDLGSFRNTCEVLSLRRFRETLLTCFEKYELPLGLFEQVEWDGFLDLFSAVVSECPISYKVGGTDRSGLIKRAILTKDTPDSYVLDLLRAMSEKPFRVWMNWRIECHDGTHENIPFYN